MDGMHYGNLWNKLGRQLRETAARQVWVAQHAATLQRLVSATTAHLRTCGAVLTRTLSCVRATRTSPLLVVRTEGSG